MCLHVLVWWWCVFISVSSYPQIICTLHLVAGRRQPLVTGCWSLGPELLVAGRRPLVKIVASKVFIPLLGYSHTRKKQIRGGFQQISTSFMQIYFKFKGPVLVVNCTYTPHNGTNYVVSRLVSFLYSLFV